MNIEINGNRVEIEMTQEQALEMIANLSKAVAHAGKTGMGYFCEGATLENQSVVSPARATIRVSV